MIPVGRLLPVLTYLLNYLHIYLLTYTLICLPVGRLLPVLEEEVVHHRLEPLGHAVVDLGDRRAHLLLLFMRGCAVSTYLRTYLLTHHLRHHLHPHHLTK